MSDSPSVYLEGTTAVYRASSLGRCTRCLVGLQLGFTPLAPPDSTQAVYARGHRVEDEVVAHLRDQGWVITGQQDVVEVAAGDGAVIRGHLDGRVGLLSVRDAQIHIDQRPILAALDTEMAVLEIKSCAESTWSKWVTNRWDTWDKWEWQVSVYGHATGLPVVIVAARIDGGGQWTGEVDTFLVPSPRIPLSRIVARVAEMQRWVEEGKLPPECPPNESYGCPLAYLCSKPEVPPDHDPALDTLAALLDRERAEKKRHEAVEKEIRGRIDELLGERDKVRTDVWSVTRVESARTTLDRDKLQEAFGDLSSYERTTISSSLRVSKRKDGGRGGTFASGGSVGTGNPREDPPHGSGGDRQDSSGDVDGRPVPADGSDENLLHTGDGSLGGDRTLPGDDTLRSEEH